MSKINIVDKKQKISIIDTTHSLKNCGHSHLEAYTCVDYKKIELQKSDFQRTDSSLDDRLLIKRGGESISLRDINRLFENDSLSELITAAACKIVDEIQKNPDKYSW